VGTIGGSLISPILLIGTGISWGVPGDFGRPSGSRSDRQMRVNDKMETHDDVR